MATPDWQHLSRQLIGARIRMGYTRRAAFARDKNLTQGQTRTVEDLENARRSNYETQTLAFIEHLYGWETGSIDAVLAGGLPTPSKTNLAEGNPRPEGHIDGSSVSQSPEDGQYVADRGPNDPSARITDEELLAVIRRQRQELDELERRLTGGRSVDGAS